MENDVTRYKVVDDAPFPNNLLHINSIMATAWFAKQQGLLASRGLYVKLIISLQQTKE